MTDDGSFSGKSATPAQWRKAVAVVAAILCRGDNVLVVRNAGVNGAADRWSLPGGSVHGGELLTDAVTREAQEETGVVVQELGPLAVYSEHYVPAFAEPMADCLRGHRAVRRCPMHRLLVRPSS